MIITLWNQLFFLCPFKITALDPPELNFVTLGLKRLRIPVIYVRKTASIPTWQAAICYERPLLNLYYSYCIMILLWSHNPPNKLRLLNKLFQVTFFSLTTIYFHSPSISAYFFLISEAISPLTKNATLLFNSI